MGILDNLKKQAEALRGRVSNGNGAAELAEFNHSAVVSSLRSIHSFLHDVVEQLYVVAQDINIEYEIPEVGSLTGLKQGRYELQSTTRGEMEVTLSYFLYQDGETKFDVPEENAELIQHGLRENGLWVVTEKNSRPQEGFTLLSVKSQVPVRFIFREDFAESVIKLRVENYEVPGSQEFSLHPDQVNDAFLDELGKYVLRMKNAFMRKLGSSFIGIKPDDEESTNGDAEPRTREISSSRIMSLFNREAHLYLAYNETIKEITSRSPEFVFGRSSECDLVVQSEFASRQHARIVFRKGKFVLIDQSRNGTFVKSQGGKELYIQGEEVPLSGSGFISLGKSASVSNAHMIYFNIQ